MSLEKVPLEQAIQTALDSVDSALSAGTPVYEAFASHLSGRFRGGAAAVQRVHDWRQRLVETPQLLTEYSDANPGPFDEGWTIAKLAGFSAPRDFGRLLYHLTRSMAPESAIELGTNLGLSAAYLATGMAQGGTGRLTTLEASEIRLQLARHLLDDLELDNVDTVTGFFADTLIPTLKRLERIDFAFIDGDHLEESTLGYFDTIGGYAETGAVLMFDDIRWSDGMFRAWKQISRDVRTQLAIDLGRVGLVVLA